MSYKAGLYNSGPANWLPGIVSHFEARSSIITLASSLRNSGLGSTSPTISGGSLVQSIPIWARTTVAGVVGSGARVDVSGNSGRFRNLNAIAGASMPVPDSNLLLNFTGSISANEIFQAVIDTLTDQTGHVWTSPNANRQPTLEVRGGGSTGVGSGQNDVFGWCNFGAANSLLPVIGAQQCLLVNSNDVGSTLFTGTGKSWTFGAGGRFTGGLALGANSNFIGAGNTAADAVNIMHFGHDGAGHHKFSCQNSAGVGFDITQSTGIAPNHGPVTLWVRYDAPSQTLSLWRRNQKIAADKTGQVLGAINWSKLCLLGASRRTVTPLDSAMMNGNLYFATFINRAISDSEQNDLDQLLAGRFGIPDSILTNAVITCIGDSIMTAVNNTNWPSNQVWIDSSSSGSLEIPILNNLAQSGNTYSPSTGANSSAQLTAQAATFVPGVKRMLINGLGTNDLGPNPSAGDLSTLITNASNWYATSKTQGWLPTEICFVMPWLNGIPPSAAFLNARLAFGNALKTLIMNDGGSPLQVVDPVSMCPSSATPGDGIYYADDKHPTSNGSQCVIPAILYLWNYIARGAA